MRLVLHGWGLRGAWHVLLEMRLMLHGWGLRGTWHVLLELRLVLRLSHIVHHWHLICWHGSRVAHQYACALLLLVLVLHGGHNSRTALHLISHLVLLESTLLHLHLVWLLHLNIARVHYHVVLLEDRVHFLQPWTHAAVHKGLLLHLDVACPLLHHVIVRHAHAHAHALTCHCVLLIHHALVHHGIVLVHHALVHHGVRLIRHGVRLIHHGVLLVHHHVRLAHQALVHHDILLIHHALWYLLHLLLRVHHLLSALELHIHHVSLRKLPLGPLALIVGHLSYKMQ